jgi:MFS family permease
MIYSLHRRLRVWRKRSLPRGQFWIYFVAAVFFNFGFSVFFFLFNLYLLNFGYDERSLGVVGSAMAVGNLCGTIPAGIAATRFGVRRTLLCGIALACLASLLRVVFVPFGVQVPLAVLGGAGLSTWGVCLSPAVASLSKARERATAFSITFASGIGVAGLGAFAAGSLPGYIRHFDSAHLSLPNAERLTLLFTLAVAVLSLFPLSRLSMASSGTSMRLVRPSTPFLRQFLPAMAVWSLVTGAFPPFASIFFVHHLGLSLEAAGTVFSLSQLVQFGAILLAPVLFRAAGLQNGIMISQLSTAGMLLALATVHSAASAGVFYWGYMAAQCMNEPGVYGLLMDRVPAADRSGASSYTFFISALSQIVASSVVGVMIVRLGYSSVLIVTASSPSSRPCSSSASRTQQLWRSQTLSLS